MHPVLAYLLLIARVAADATAKQLRDENQRLLGQLEKARATNEEQMFSKAQLEGLVKDKDRELTNAQKDLGAVNQELNHLRTQQTLLQERTKLDQTRLMTDVRREMESQSSALRDIERLRGETLGARDRDYNRKIGTLNTEVSQRA